jgi:hypothetical protein
MPEPPELTAGYDNVSFREEEFLTVWRRAPRPAESEPERGDKLQR